MAFLLVLLTKWAQGSSGQEKNGYCSLICYVVNFLFNPLGFFFFNELFKNVGCDVWGKLKVMYLFDKDCYQWDRRNPWYGIACQYIFFFLFLVGKMWLVVDNATLPSACDGRFCFLYFQVLKYRYALPPCPDWWGSAFLSCFQCLVSFSRKEDFIFEPWRWLPIHKAYVRVYRCVFIHTCLHIHMHTAFRHRKASPRFSLHSFELSLAPFLECFYPARPAQNFATMVSGFVMAGVWIPLRVIIDSVWMCVLPCAPWSGWDQMLQREMSY